MLSILTPGGYNFLPKYKGVSNQDATAKETSKTQQVLKTLHVFTPVYFISSPSLRDYNVKLSNETCYRGRKHSTTNFLPLLKLPGALLKTSTPELQSSRSSGPSWPVEIAAVNFELRTI